MNNVKLAKDILRSNIYCTLAIFDSHQKEGAGNGIQGIGKARLLHDREIFKAKWINGSR